MRRAMMFEMLIQERCPINAGGQTLNLPANGRSSLF
jgi:hypothetical protein